MKQEDPKQKVLGKVLKLFPYDSVSVGEIVKTVGIKALPFFTLPVQKYKPETSQSVKCWDVSSFIKGNAAQSGK
ncbi:MAG TPA: hypothetical protein DDY87_05420 [Clostridiales bacterium]|nr:hypothetical protein [Clostridiales bacterium]